MILLDTSVISAVLRRRRRGPPERDIAAKVQTLLDSDQTVGLPGIVFQEVLSGIAEVAQLERVLGSIRESFPVLLATEADHVGAARLVNAGAAVGIAVSAPDALIAAQTIGRRATLFTADPDFRRLARFSSLQILQ